LEQKLVQQCQPLVNQLQHSTNPIALQNCGKYFELLNSFDTALEYYTKAYELDKNNLEITNCCSVTQARLGSYEQAANFSELCFSLSKDLYYMKRAAYYYASCCNWEDETRCWNRSVKAPHPFFDISRFTDPADCRLSAENMTKTEGTPTNTITVPISKDQPTIGFLSGEFREHATMKLLISVLEDLSVSDTFKIVLFDNGPKDNSKYRSRLENMGAIMHDISMMTDNDAHRLIRKTKTDVLINLNGFFGRHRNALFFRRSAPIQINYLGFPGTMGHPSIDYLIGDESVTPISDQRYYSERLVNLTGCYQPQDSRRTQPLLATRRELNLPEDAFLYCSFNNNYKITSEIFESWLSILKGSNDSKLVLLQDNEDAARNLKITASRYDLESRLIFFPRQKTDQYLQTLAQCDLFLDTYPYNAHTTCADALFVGLPVLTRSGKTFPSRVAKSILASYSLAEEGLVANSQAEYEEKALSLKSSGRATSLKERILRHHELYRRPLDKKYPVYFASLLKDILAKHKFTNEIQ
jgi:predicted O-linked N-acetylglucosamine transferase (SPINDLY family)